MTHRDQHDEYIIRSWDIPTGFMVWEKKNPSKHNVTNRFEYGEPRVDIVFTANSRVAILIEGITIINLDSTNGQQVWRSDVTARYS